MNVEVPMSMWGLVQTYLAALTSFLVLDFIWLGFVARGFYRDQLGGLMAADVRWWPAIAFYLLFVLAIMVFVVLPSLSRDSVARVALLGAFFGVVTYATYDLTNLATMRGFPAIVAAVDMVWGGILTASVATVGYLVASRLAA